MKEKVCEKKSSATTEQKKCGKGGCSAKKCDGSVTKLKQIKSEEVTEVVKEKSEYKVKIEKSTNSVAEASNMLVFDDDAMSIMMIARTGSLFDYEKVQ